MAIKRTGVNSTCLRSIGHDKDAKKLSLEFKTSGAVYEYSGVSTRSANNLRKAASRGRHFNKHVRNEYPYKRVRASRPRRGAKRHR